MKVIQGLIGIISGIGIIGDTLITWDLIIGGIGIILIGVIILLLFLGRHVLDLMFNLEIHLQEQDLDLGNQMKELE